MSAARALAASLLALLRADATLAAGLGTRIWDAAPRDPDFPHLVLDEVVARDRSGQDTMLEEIRLTLRLFSRGGGRVEVAGLAERVETVIAGAILAPAGVRVVLLRREATEIRPLRDRVTTEAVLRLVALTEPA